MTPEERDALIDRIRKVPWLSRPDRGLIEDMFRSETFSVRDEMQLDTLAQIYLED